MEFAVLSRMKIWTYTCILIAITGCSGRTHITKPETVLESGTFFEITATVNGSVGTGFQLISANTQHVRLLQKTSMEESGDGEKCFGCSTELTWVFKALKPGTAVIRFRNSFRFEKDRPDTRYVIHVQE
jgi:predicted secreted protein